jgi:hypothetical protein
VIEPNIGVVIESVFAALNLRIVKVAKGYGRDRAVVIRVFKVETNIFVLDDALLV